MPPPNAFSPGTYADWHKSQFHNDDPLLEKVAELRAGLLANSRAQLNVLAQVLTYAADYSSNEYYQQMRSTADFQVSLSDAVNAKPTAPTYDLLFKSTASIINKLWRKNRQVPAVHLGNIQTQITDLVRTDISATTLDSAAFLAYRMNALPSIIYEPEVRKAFEDAIATIQFAPEMKMESGYFAYHGLVHFKTGLVVEVQIYSDLMRQWRKLSHTLYERARVEPVKEHEFNSKESRLISLGHLLHLAECQLQQLHREFGGH